MYCCVFTICFVFHIVYKRTKFPVHGSENLPTIGRNHCIADQRLSAFIVPENELQSGRKHSIYDERSTQGARLHFIFGRAIHSIAERNHFVYLHRFLQISLTVFFYRIGW